MGLKMKYVAAMVAFLSMPPVLAASAGSAVVVQAAEDYNADDFVIEKNVLKKYKGKDSEVVIPDGVKTIGRAAFRWNHDVVSVTIPDSVTKINQEAFYACPKLEKVIGGKNVTYVGLAAFGFDRELSEIDLAGVKDIGMQAFSGCEALHSVNLSSLKEIGEEAFAGSGLQEVKGFKETQIEKAGSRAFTGTEWQKAYWGTAPVILGGVLIDGQNCVGEVVIPEGTVHIADCAFRENDKIISVSMPQTLKSIGNEAFADCHGLKYVRMEDSVTEIGEWGFFECKQLKAIRFSNEITTLPMGVLNVCQKLTSITLPEKWQPEENTSLGFWNPNLTAITLPTDVECMPNLPIAYVDKEGHKYMYSDVMGVELTVLRPILYVTEIKPDSFLAGYAQENGYELKELALNQTKLTLAVGDKHELRFNSGANAIWKSSNKKVAAVGKTGNIYAKRAGTAMITATIYGKEYTCKVTVR